MRYIIFFLYTGFIFKAQAQSTDKSCLVVTDKVDAKFDFQNSILNEEIKNFYNSNNKYDIILIRYRMGSPDYTLKRLEYFNNSSIYKEFSHGKKDIFESPRIADAVLNDLFNGFVTKGVLSTCIVCFDCDQYVGLIKKDNQIFFYKLDNAIESEIDGRLYNYQRIFKLLKSISK